MINTAFEFPVIGLTTIILIPYSLKKSNVLLFCDVLNFQLEQL